MSSRRTVLVVDDSAFMRKLISEIVDGSDEFRVVGTARNGLDALSQIHSLEPSIVTLDLEMPELDGLQATRRIRREAPDRAVWIVAMTANAMAGDREACLAAGMNDYLSKPIRPGELADALARAPRIAGPVA